jgi:hypothetical protein
VLELADDDGDAAKQTRLDDGVVCREGTPAHNTMDSESQSTRSNYGAMRIRTSAHGSEHSRRAKRHRAKRRIRLARSRQNNDDAARQTEIGSRAPTTKGATRDRPRCSRN